MSYIMWHIPSLSTVAVSGTETAVSSLMPPDYYDHHMQSLQCIILFVDNLHGSLNNIDELDSNLYDTISFNATDRAKISGIIDRVSIKFSTAPAIEDPAIHLFVIAAEIDASNPDWFKIVATDHLTKHLESKTSGKEVAAIGKQQGSTVAFSTHIKIKEGQYLAIRFGSNAGNPYCIEGNQYYVKSPIVPDVNQSLLFTHCPTKGIAMQFNIQSKST